MLYENERLDRVNDGLYLIQKTDGLTFGTDALLLAAYAKEGLGKAAELGGGTGIISMLILTRGKASTVDAYEVQEEYSTLIERNAKKNGLEERLHAINCDIRDCAASEAYDAVLTNPPYMRCDAGKRNALDKKNAARHEVFGGISDFTEAGRKMLRFGGSFYAVYRPDRLIDLISAMRDSRLEPKRMTFVYADTASEPSMVLIEAKKGGKSGLIATPPLIIYRDTGHTEYTSEMNFIMDMGAFPEGFQR